MAKPPRSPLLGYNHNVKYGGQIFHVQTEDSGPGNPHVFTHLFFEGSILGSKRCQYDPSASEEDVRVMMQTQHKAILKELKQKTYDDRITRFFETRGETFRSEDLLADPAQEGAPPTEPVAERAAAPVDVPPPIEAIAEAAVLDLDALPPAPGDRGPTPEPLPMHLTKPAVPGPGTYTFRRPHREEFPGEPVQPPSLPRVPKPAPARPIAPVVVQRQVVVGAGAPPATTMRKATTTPVRRRPVSGGPYVVKEGSHANIPGTVRRADATPVTEAAKAPRTADVPAAPPVPPPQEAPPAALVTDQSLDDVILAYLSQGEGKR